MPEGFVQQVLGDADEVLGVLPHVITTLRRGVLIANAGVDQSNVDPAHGDLVALPRDPDATALALMRLLRARYGVPVGVIVADSVVHALRRGTAGCALGVAGLHAVSSELGRSDLFGRAMRITSRAVADNICSAALLLMGETDERLCFPLFAPCSFSSCCVYVCRDSDGGGAGLAGADAGRPRGRDRDDGRGGHPARRVHLHGRRDGAQPPHAGVPPHRICGKQVIFLLFSLLFFFSVAWSDALHTPQFFTSGTQQKMDDQANLVFFFFLVFRRVTDASTARSTEHGARSRGGPE